MLTGLVFYSSKNIRGRCDATGAFEPEAIRFAKVNGLPRAALVPVPCVDFTFPALRKIVLTKLGQEERQLDVVAFFGHGWVDGFQFGFTRRSVDLLGAALANCCSTDASIVLYACSTAENDVTDNCVEGVSIGTDGGFADMLRDSMTRFGLDAAWVDAHKTPGRATMNPMVVRFRCADVEDRQLGGVGGDWLVAPGSSVWRKWRSALAAEKDLLRFKFPFMSSAEIKRVLEGA